MRTPFHLCVLLCITFSRMGYADDTSTVVLPARNATRDMVKKYLADAAKTGTEQSDVVAGVQCHHVFGVRPLRWERGLLKIGDMMFVSDVGGQLSLDMDGRQIATLPDCGARLVSSNGRLLHSLDGDTLREDCILVLSFSDRLLAYRNKKNGDSTLGFAFRHGRRPKCGESVLMIDWDDVERRISDLSRTAETSDVSFYQHLSLSCLQFGLIPQFFFGDRVPLAGKIMLRRTNQGREFSLIDVGTAKNLPKPLVAPEIILLSGTGETYDLAEDGQLQNSGVVIIWTGTTAFTIRIATRVNQVDKLCHPVEVSSVLQEPGTVIK